MTNHITIVIIHSLNQRDLINSQDEAFSMKDEPTHGAPLPSCSASFLCVLDHLGNLLI